MNAFLLFFALLASVSTTSGQVFAIVTVEYTTTAANPLRQFAIQLDNDHAPRSVATLMLLGQPRTDFYRNRNATLSLNPAGEYVPAREDGSLLLPSSTIYRITAAPVTNPTTAILQRQGSGSVMANLTRNGSTWISDNPAFTVAYNGSAGVQRYTLKVRSELPYYDSSDNFFRGPTGATSNPSGDYTPALSSGFAVPGDSTAVYQIVADSFFPDNTGATLFLKESNAQVARLTRSGTAWTSSNPGFTLSLIFDSSSNSTRFLLRQDVALVPALTKEPFYGPDDLLRVGGNFPFLSLGRAKAVPNQANGLTFQNEIVDVNFASFNDANLWGARFATSNGLVGAAQRYAVAFANSSEGTPNTAGGELLITGFNGNPFFDGRHTHVGTVVNGTYSRLSGPPVVASRITVDELVNGQAARFRSIEFENRATVFDAIEYVNPLLAGIRLPTARQAPPTAAKVDFSRRRRAILSGGQPGELRFLERSSDLVTWSPVGKSGYPLGATQEYGLSVDWPSQPGGPGGTLRSLVEAFPRSFFRTLPMAISYPKWPAAEFDAARPNRQLSFKGRSVDGTNPQVLNVFNLFLNSNGTSGTLQGIGGDLAGTHSLPSVTFEQTSPYVGELRLVSATLPEGLLRLRLYFDGHKGGELTGGRKPIERFHRVITQEVEIGGNILLLEQVSEFGIWVANN